MRFRRTKKLFEILQLRFVDYHINPKESRANCSKIIEEMADKQFNKEDVEIMERIADKLWNNSNISKPEDIQVKDIIEQLNKERGWLVSMRLLFRKKGEVKLAKKLFKRIMKIYL